jgi:kinesin family protein 2/24
VFIVFIIPGKLFDLLNNRKKLVAREDGNAKVNIVGLQEKQVVSEEELLNAMDAGNVARCFGASSAAACSLHPLSSCSFLKGPRLQPARTQILRARMPSCRWPSNVPAIAPKTLASFRS